MNIRLIVILTILTALQQSAVAQTNSNDTVINGATIEIIQSYKPEVKELPKPELIPGLPPVDTATPDLNYHVPEQTLYYTYSSQPLRPLALDMKGTEQPFPNYVKIGGGNLSTLYLDAGIGSLKGDNYETAIHVDHLSQSGEINEQRVSLTGLEADGTLHSATKTWHARLGVRRDQYHYYGYDHSLYNYDLSSVRQAFTNISIAADMRNEAEVSDLTYHPTVKAILYSDSYAANETSFEVSVPVYYAIDDNLKLYASANAWVTSYNSPGATQSNNIYQLAPGVLFQTNTIKGHAGISPTFGQNGSQYFLPDAEIEFNIPETQLMMFVGWKGTLRQNRYEQLSTLNPFMNNVYTVQQTRTNEGYAGVKSNIGNNITFSGKVSWWDHDNLPLFINDTAFDMKQFNIVYDNVNAISLQASIRYQVAETFSLGFSSQWINFYQKTYEQVWHRPGMRFTGDFLLQPTKNLTVTAYASFIDQLYALEKNNRTIKLNTLLDIGAGAEYKVVKRLNVFVQANNLLNNTYQRWYQYDAFGVNFFGGARLKF